MKRINLKNDDISWLKCRKVGEYINIPMYIRLSGKNCDDFFKHMERNYPLKKLYRVCEDISEYTKTKNPSGYMEFSQDGYTADVNEYHAQFGYFQGKIIYPASKMPKEYSRFTLEAVSYGTFIMQSCSWAYTSVRFMVKEIKNVELPHSGK